jgi:hypothetical protein
MPGFPPQYGDQQLIDGIWLLALAGGQNRVYESGLTAHAGGTQAAGFQIPSGFELIEFDTVANAADSAILPFATTPGTIIVVINSTATSMNVYANPGTNPVTGVADKLNGSTSAAVAVAAGNTTTPAAVRFYCVKAGVWQA